MGVGGYVWVMDVLVGQQVADFTRCARTRIAIVHFSNFPKEIVVYHSELTVQRCSSGTVAT